MLANLGVIAFLTRNDAFIRPSVNWLRSMLVVLLLQTAGGIAVRLTIDLVRRRRVYLRRIRRPAWIIETLRLVVASAVAAFTYGWVKQAMPVLRPGVFDQQLWNVDQALFFGIAPTTFFLELFGNPAFLRAIDWSYALIFYASTVIAAAYFLSDGSRRVKVAFVNGNAVLWVLGGWLYYTAPSLGPAFRFPEIWLPYGAALVHTQQLQATLMANYQSVMRAMRGEPHGPINMVFSIAAFPSLHVAFQTYVFFWMRKLWTSGEVLFGIFTAAIFLGAMITGWHYFIDAVAGLLLAWFCWWIFWRRARMARFLRLF